MSGESRCQGWLRDSQHPEQWRACRDLAGGSYWERLPPHYTRIRGIEEKEGRL